MGVPRCARAARGLTSALAAALLAACASTPPEHFYTLDGPIPSPVASAPALSRTAPLYLEITPVKVPEQLSRKQWVLTTGAGEVNIEEQRRWSAPLSAEIGAALASDLTRRLDAINVYRSAYPSGSTVYRISVNVTRFESMLGRRVRLSAVWSVRRLPSGVVLTCRSAFQEPVEAGYDALVAGHRRALARLADVLADTVASLAVWPDAHSSASLADSDGSGASRAPGLSNPSAGASAAGVGASSGTVRWPGASIGAYNGPACPAVSPESS